MLLKLCIFRKRLLAYLTHGFTDSSNLQPSNSSWIIIIIKQYPHEPDTFAFESRSHDDLLVFLFISSSKKTCHLCCMWQKSKEKKKKKLHVAHHQNKCQILLWRSIVAYGRQQDPCVICSMYVMLTEEGSIQSSLCPSVRPSVRPSVCPGTLSDK